MAMLTIRARRFLKNTGRKLTVELGNPQMDLQDKGVIDSGCSRHMIPGNMSYLTDYEEINEGYVALWESPPKEGKSQAELTDESHVLLKVPRKNNMYNVDLKNIVPKGGLICLFAKATFNESELWHRRLGHINFKTMNKLVKGNLVRGLPSKLFENTQTCVAFQKGKQHRASCKSKTGNPQMDLQDQGVIDSGCSRYMTGNMSYLTDYKEIDGGYVAFGGTKACEDVCKARMKTIPGKDYILLPLWTADPPFYQSSKSSPDAGFKPSGDDEKKKDASVNSTNNVNAANTNEVNVVGRKASIELPNEPNMPALEDIVYSDNDEDVGTETDMNNLDAFMPVSPIPTRRVHKDHPVEQIIRDFNLVPQTRRMIKNLEEHGLFSSVQQRTNHKDFKNYLFACFLSQEEPKKVIHALKDPSWIEAMQ
ncbi:ribonuclease H-like domain-containing protein, partial [Tanacetum coccineum]